MSRLAAASQYGLALLIEALAARWPLANPLRLPLSELSDDDIDSALRADGKDRRALFSPGPGNAPHRRRMARMMAHYGVTPGFAVRRYWRALRRADRLCTECRSRRRCLSWLDWPANEDAPRVFCPNAETFEAIAQDERAGRSERAAPPGRPEGRAAGPFVYH